MTWTSVDSSNLDAVKYDAGDRLLTVRFNNGRVYRYRGVPEPTVNNLITAPSVGSYFHEHIRDQFPTERVR